MTHKPDTILWRGPHPDNPTVGLRVVARPSGDIYGEEYEVEQLGGATGRTLASLPIRHVAAIAIRDLVEKVGKAGGATK